MLTEPSAAAVVLLGSALSHQSWQQTGAWGAGDVQVAGHSILGCWWGGWSEGDFCWAGAGLQLQTSSGWFPVGQGQATWGPAPRPAALRVRALHSHIWSWRCLLGRSAPNCVAEVRVLCPVLSSELLQDLASTYGGLCPADPLLTLFSARSPVPPLWGC